MNNEQYKEFLATRRNEILDRVAKACKKSHRTVSDIDICCVSKTVDTNAVMLAREVGWKHFAENRPQELSLKLEELEGLGVADDYVFDLIGNLQTNKINQVLQANPRLIQSVDSLKLAENISKRAIRDNLCVPCLLQVNTSGETSKSGMSEKEIKRDFEFFLDLEGIDCLGLMCMAPLNNPTQARRCFRKARTLQDQLISEYEWELPLLSAGMSNDFEIAIEEGSNLIRLGRVVFDCGYNLK